MSDSELIKEIKARKNWIFLAVLLVITASVIYYIKVPFIYRSTVSFFIDDDEAQGLKFNETDLILSKTSNVSRLYNFAKSTEMTDYLIEKFHLYNHFNIEPGSELHYETVTSFISGSIIIKQNLFNSISITVYDADRELAAEMANEIFKKLDAMNKDFIIANIERKISIYDQLLANIKKQSLEQVEQLKSLIDECNQLLANSEHSKKQDNNHITDLKVNFALLTSQLTTVNADLLKTSRAYGLSVATVQKENIPNLRVINMALPDLRSPLILAISWTVALSVASAFLTVLIIVLLHEYKFKLRALFQ